MDKLRKIGEKRAMARHYNTSYGIKIDPQLIERLTEKQLLIKLHTKY